MYSFSSSFFSPLLITTVFLRTICWDAHAAIYTVYCILQGPGSKRLSTMLPQSTLYHEGAKHLVRNDIAYKSSNDILTNRQVFNTALQLITRAEAGFNDIVYVMIECCMCTAMTYFNSYSILSVSAHIVLSRCIHYILISVFSTIYSILQS
jgi:hypothetical protein